MPLDQQAAATQQTAQTPSPLNTAVEPLLTLEEISRYLKVTDRAIRQWIKKDNFPNRRAGEDLRFDRSEVDAWTKRPRYRQTKSANAKISPLLSAAATTTRSN